MKEQEKTKTSERTMKETYDELKQKHPERILLLRYNDFYHICGEDARDASEILNIALLRKEDESAEAIASFPFHALDTYLPKLIRAGKRVAICDFLDSSKS